MNLEQLLRGTLYDRVSGSLERTVAGLSYDSRTTAEGDVFFCLPGLKSDGHAYAQGAADRGAQAVVLTQDIPLPDGVTKVFVQDVRKAMAAMASTFHGDAWRSMTLIGVTGTNGKTTITYFIKSVLEEMGKKVGLIGTITHMIGDQRILSKNTTPEAVELHQLFAQMAGEGVDTVVMEVSSHSLALDRVYGLTYDAAVLTNLTQDHLDFHKTIEAYKEAKAKLFHMSRIRILNADDAFGAELIASLRGEARPDAPVISYGIQKNADVYGRDMEITARGVSFELHLPNLITSVNLSIPGIFSAYNALAASTVCHALGATEEPLRHGLEQVRVPGRFEVLETNTPYTVLIDYAHTPDGLDNILRTVNSFVKGRVVTLFGCGGDRDKTKRPLMGESAGRGSDFCIVTSDNPRTENPHAIIEDILPGMRKSGCPHVVIAERREAIGYALKNGRPGDVIVLAGKGHENYQILKDRTIPFDEKEIVFSFLKQGTVG